MRLGSIRLGAAILVMVSACGGSTAGESSSEDDPGGATESSIVAKAVSGDDTEPATGRVGATVTIDTEVHEISGDVACLTGAALSLTFANANDEISINHANDVILIRMTIDGADWVDTGSPPAPDVNGGGADAVVSWSGPMSSGGASEQVAIEVHC